MSYYGILKQAELADKIGNYRLADNLLSKLIRLAKSSPKEIKLLFGIDDLIKRLTPPAGSKTLPKALNELVTETVVVLVKELKKPTASPELIKTLDDLKIAPPQRTLILNKLKSGDAAKQAEVEKYLSTKISDKYKADLEAAKTVPPPSSPKPPETSPASVGPEEAKKALKEEIEKIVAEHKDNPKVMREKLKELGFNDDMITNATVGDVININTLSGATKPGGFPILSPRHIQVGDEILELSKINFENAQRLLIDIKDLPEDSKLKLIKKLTGMLDRDGSLVLRPELKDTGMFNSKYFAVRATTTPPGETPGSTAPTTPGSTADEAAEGASNAGQPINWKAWAAKASVAALALYGLYNLNGVIMSRLTGKPATDAEGNAAMNSALGKDPDKLNSKMYDDRMKANQQQRQNQAAQKFVDENKSKFKTQRDFYNAAKAAGDENFANDVIAIVKKDMSMDVGPRYS